MKNVEIFSKKPKCKKKPKHSDKKKPKRPPYFYLNMGEFIDSENMKMFSVLNNNKLFTFRSFNLLAPESTLVH